MKETKTQLQQKDTVAGSTDKQKAAVTVAEKPNKEEKQMPEKKGQKCKNEFEKHNREEEKQEKEKELQDIAACREVIDALMKTRDAAETAVVHMEGILADGEDIEDLLLKQTSVKSAHDFLNYVSLLGMKEAKKRKKKEGRNSAK